MSKKRAKQETVKLSAKKKYLCFTCASFRQDKNGFNFLLLNFQKCFMFTIEKNNMFFQAQNQNLSIQSTWTMFQLVLKKRILPF